PFPWGLLLFVFAGLEKLLQGVQPPIPELLVALDPRRRTLHRSRHEPAVVDPPVLLAGEQPGMLEDAQVLRDRGERDVERRRELAYRRRGPLREVRNDGAARRVGQRAEGGVEGGGGGTINHMVNYITAGGAVKFRMGRAIAARTS